MRLPRFRLRTLMIAVAVVAAACCLIRIVFSGTGGITFIICAFGVVLYLAILAIFGLGVTAVRAIEITAVRLSQKLRKRPPGTGAFRPCDSDSRRGG
jgi:uncharacterized membrane protein